MKYYIPLLPLTFHRILFSNHYLYLICISFERVSLFLLIFLNIIYFSIINLKILFCFHSMGFVLLNWQNCLGKFIIVYLFTFTKCFAFLNTFYSINVLIGMHFMEHCLKLFWYSGFSLPHHQTLFLHYYYLQTCIIYFLYNIHDCVHHNHSHIAERLPILYLVFFGIEDDHFNLI